MVTAEAYATCLRLAAAHYENFPVASRLLPKASRPHIAAVYAFARVADDFADEGNRSAGERLGLLEDWQRRLHEAVAGRIPEETGDAPAIFTALRATIEAHQLDIRLFEDLLSAFAQDVLVSRYDSWAELMDYCRRSANPVGRLVLRICGYRNTVMDQQSDAICTALQLTNFWQDLAIDWSRGRLYVPRDVLDQAGASEADLTGGRWPDAWEAALRASAQRTRDLFDRGRPLVNALGGRLRYEIGATWLGGVRILDALEARRFNVFEKRPRLGLIDAAVIGGQLLRWRS